MKQSPQNAVWAVGTPAGRQKSQNLEKRAFLLPSVSHNVHYTKIHILKIRTFPSRRFLRSGGPDDLGCGILIFGTGNGLFPVLRIIGLHPAAAWCQNMHRWPRSKYAQFVCSPVRCQSVPHHPHWSQSIVPPARPDSLHLPAV